MSLGVARRQVLFQDHPAHLAVDILEVQVGDLGGVLAHKVDGALVPLLPAAVDGGIVPGVKAQLELAVLQDVHELGLGLDEGLVVLVEHGLDAVLLAREPAHLAEHGVVPVPVVRRQALFELAVIAHVGAVHRDEIFGVKGGQAAAQGVHPIAYLGERAHARKFIACRARADT